MILMMHDAIPQLIRDQASSVGDTLTSILPLSPKLSYPILVVQFPHHLRKSSRESLLAGGYSETKKIIFDN